MEASAILSIENGLWILEGSRGRIDNDVVDDGGIAFSIDGEETEWTLAKAQSEVFKEVRGFLDSTEVIEHGFPNVHVGFRLDVKGKTEIITPINWRRGKG